MLIRKGAQSSYRATKGIPGAYAGMQMSGDHQKVRRLACQL
jgi:hypothetical protein